MTDRTITAVFDTRDEALNATEALAGIGVARSAMQIRSNPTEQAANESDKGFWASLGDMFSSDDRPTYEEALRRGNFMVTASVDDACFDAASDILEGHGAVDLDERETTWRGEGWTGSTGADANPPGTMLSRGVDDVAGTNISGARPEHEGQTMANGVGVTGGVGATAGAGMAGSTDLSGTGSIPVIQETLRIGKREVSGGRIRVRSYVVETPVEEDVSLRTEPVNVQRRAVDRDVTVRDQVRRSEVEVERDASALPPRRDA